MTALLHVFLVRTFTGKAIRAISQDREAGLLVAIDAGKVALVAFGLGAALAGSAGALVAMIYVITPTMGILFTVKAFTVMVVGVVLWTMSGRIARHIAQPLYELMRVAQEIGAGHLKARARVPVWRIGEIAVLAQAINDMAERIER